MKYYPFICDFCKKEFLKSGKDVAARRCNERVKELKHIFCSRKCLSLFYKTSVDIPCANCQKIVTRTQAERKGMVNSFCNSSCAATYNNKHKTHGNRRSKLEKCIEEKIKEVFPSIEYHANSKTAIGSELDFYFPTFKLAIEINGIFHYEPIYGLEKLTQIQKNDQQKFKACHDAGVELCIIACLDGYMNKQKLEYYWDKVKTLLETKLRG